MILYVLSTVYVCRPGNIVVIVLWCHTLLFISIEHIYCRKFVLVRKFLLECLSIYCIYCTVYGMTIFHFGYPCMCKHFLVVSYLHVWCVHWLIYYYSSFLLMFPELCQVLSLWCWVQCTLASHRVREIITTSLHTCTTPCTRHNYVTMYIYYVRFCVVVVIVFEQLRPCFCIHAHCYSNRLIHITLHKCIVLYVNSSLHTQQHCSVQTTSW